jgi:hypothetical protein
MREVLVLATATVAAAGPCLAAHAEPHPAPQVRAVAPGGALQPFEAHYRVSYRGLSVGGSTLRLSRGDGETWIYESRNLARGLARLAFPDPITQTSRFRLHDGAVQPLAYSNDDGSRATDRDVKLAFDWSAHRVTGTAQDRGVDVPLKPGTQDALSVQIALMRELAAGREPREFLLIDKDEIKEYRYEREGDIQLDTALGRVPTVVYRSQATGSSRVTRMWLAPSLGYLPVRAEQRRGTRVDFALEIDRVEGR